MMKSHIDFSLKQGTTEERANAILEEMKSWPGVGFCGRLSPSSKDDALSRMCYVVTDEKTFDDLIIRHLNTVPELEDIEVAPQRYLID